MEDLPVNTYFWEHADGSWMIGDAQWCRQGKWSFHGL